MRATLPQWFLGKPYSLHHRYHHHHHSTTKGQVLVTIFASILLILGFMGQISPVLGQSLSLEVNPTGPRVDWPDNDHMLNLGMWVDYAIFVGIVAVCIVLIGILLELMDCIIWCSRRVCNCCGGSKLEVSERRESICV